MRRSRGLGTSSSSSSSSASSSLSEDHEAVVPSVPEHLMPWNSLYKSMTGRAEEIPKPSSLAPTVPHEPVKAFIVYCTSEEESKRPPEMGGPVNASLQILRQSGVTISE